MVSLGTLKLHCSRSQRRVDVKSFGHPCYNSGLLALEHGCHDRNRDRQQATRRPSVMPTPERPVLPDHPTKHQLDELDALMERMLALPINQPEDLVSIPKLPARPVKTVSLPMVQPTFAVREILEPKQMSAAPPTPVKASPIEPTRS